MKLNQIASSALQLLFPRVCPVCGEILTDRERAERNPYICKYCYEKLAFVAEPKCLQCGAPLQKEAQELCRNCGSKKRYFDQGVSLLQHDDRARKMLYDLKYAGRRDNADFLGLEAANRLAGKILQWKPDVLVPVPLHKKRQFERGFNQAELLAEKLAVQLRKKHGLYLPVNTFLLVRNGKTRPQKELQMEERAENVAGKFRLGPDARDPDRRTGNGVLSSDGAYDSLPERVLLSDDIFTSGATINECAKVLKQAGVKEVYFVTMSIVG